MAVCAYERYSSCPTVGSCQLSDTEAMFVSTVASLKRGSKLICLYTNLVNMQHTFCLKPHDGLKAPRLLFVNYVFGSCLRYYKLSLCNRSRAQLCLKSPISIAIRSVKVSAELIMSSGLFSICMLAINRTRGMFPVSYTTSERPMPSLGNDCPSFYVKLYRKKASGHVIKHQKEWNDWQSKI